MDDGPTPGGYLFGMICLLLSAVLVICLCVKVAGWLANY